LLEIQLRAGDIHQILVGQPKVANLLLPALARLQI